ncbi:hypothetical protein [Roseateles chitosanitabidus]|uniref:hypothetical protein n=1 Tax=Roseateles chitosanitabidus TaxID=65048 RepID=UPI000833EB7D|nr:hypothetical protein [Roseateles chitosanitabidus]
MATITAAAGGGNWNSTGTWNGGVVPGASDDVRLDASSGSVAITAAAACRSLDCSGYTGTLTHGAFTLSIGDGTAGANSIALRLVAGMTYTLASVTTSAIAFVSTAAALQQVALGAKAVGNVTFSAAGNWALTSAMTQDPTAALTHSAGTVRYDGLTDDAALSHSLGVITSTGSTARALYGGKATITLTRSTATNQINIAGGNLTTDFTLTTFIGAPTSVGRISYTYLLPGVGEIGSLILNGQGERTVGSTCTIGTLTRNGTANPFDMLGIGFGQTVTVTKALNVLGGGGNNRCGMWPNTTSIPGTFRVVGAAVNLQHVDMQDIYWDNGGADLDFSSMAGGISDGGNNGMVNGGRLIFQAPIVHTWLGGTGNWSDTTKWSSGRVPLAQDDVLFLGAFASSPIISVDRKWACKNLSFAGSTGNVTLRADVYEVYVNGNVTFRNGVTWGVSASCQWCAAPRENVTWLAGGMPSSAVLHSPSWQIGLGVSLTVGDAFLIGGTLNHRCGKVNIPAGASFAVDSYISNANQLSAKCAFDIAGSLLLRGTGTIFSLTNGAAYTVVNDLGGRIVLAGTTAATRTFATGGISFCDIQLAAGASTFAFTGSFSVPRIPRPSTPGSVVMTLAAGSVMTVRSSGDDAMDNGANVVTIKSATAGTAATISKAAGRVRADYLNLQDITATGGALYSAGANSTNTSGNTGWSFTAANDWAPQGMLAA